MRIGLIGSGRIGSAIARLAAAQGHDVVLSNSRGPATLADLVASLGPQASAATATDASAAGDIVVVAIPVREVPDVPAQPLAGKIVIDANNYYPQRDGQIAALDSGATTSAEFLAAHLRDARVVKAFNNIAASQLQGQGQPAGSANRRALPIAGDDADAKNVVTDLIDSFGYDVVDAGHLADGRRFQPNTPAYGTRFTADELRKALGL
jgi:predicted dinucleotide-binding enzyme